MPKSANLNRRRWLKCMYCHNPFVVGRSYSNHVSRCPSQHLLVSNRKTAPQLQPQVDLYPDSATTQHNPASGVARLPSSPHSSSNSSSPHQFHDDDNSSASSVPISTTIQHGDFIFSDSSSDSDEEPNPDFSAAHAQLKKNFLSFVSSTAPEIYPPDHSDEPAATHVPPLSFLEPHTIVNPEVPPPAPVKKHLFPAFHCYTIDDAVHLRLMNLCHDIAAPMYAYDSILNWAQDAKLSGYSFPTDAPSRKTYLDHLYDRFNMHGIKPIENEVPLYPDKIANVITFPFREMVESLTSDDTLMQAKNLLLHLPTAGQHNTRSDINTGSWYRKAHSKLCVNGQDLLCPIILFIDKTQIDTFSKWTLEPVLFTLGIFNLETRNLSSAWRPLGLVTNTIRSSSAQNAQLGKKVIH